MRANGPTGFRRKALAPLAAAAACAFLAIGCLAGCSSGTGTTRVVRVGFLNNDLHQLAYYVAKEKGYFTDEGLDVREAGRFNAGPEEMSGFSAGDLDMGYVGVAPAITFDGQGMADVQVVAQANMAGSSILVRPGLEADDVSALAGRTVAIPGVSTVQDFLLRTALASAGVAANQVNMIVVKPPEMLAALAAGQIDAAVAWEPYPAMAVAQGSARVLETSEKIWPHHPCCMVVADRQFVRKNPDLVSRFVAAHVKATDFIKKNPQEAADMAHMYLGIDRNVALAAMKNIEFGYTPNRKAIQRYVSFMAQAGVIKTNSAAAFTSSLVDTSFIPGGGH